MPAISAVILTFNEERNIERCLRSVKDVADEIVVIDSFSNDNTENICKKYNVKFIQHTFKGHIEQKNWGITQASYPHILSLDADEALSDELKKSILSVKENWKYDSYYFNRLTNYCGKWIKHTSWYPARKLRLWDSRKGEWGGINPHDKFIMEKKTSQKFLKGDLLHYSYYSINEHITQINKFTDIVSRAYYEKGLKAGYSTIVMHALWRGFRDYFIRLGFLDGFYGFVVSFNSAYETYLKYVKLRDLYINTQKKNANKICFFNSTRSWGGGEKWHYDISTRLSNKGFKTIVITNKKSVLFNRLKDTLLPLYSIRVHNLSFLNIFKIIKISKILKKENINTIILNLSADLKVAGFAAKIAGVDNIIYRRGSAIPIRNTLLNRFIFNNVVTEIIANSYETKRTILKNNPDLFDETKIKIIYNGINFDDYYQKIPEPIYKRKGKEIILGNAGRLEIQKGQKYLIDIARKLKDKNMDFKLLIAGEGRLKKGLIRQAKIMGVDDKIEFLGFIKDIKAFMQSIDVFLLTSLWEGFGYVIIEAMAYQKPVVAFDVSSNPEIIKNNTTGYLIRYQNIEEFIEKVKLLCDNRELRINMGDKAKDHVKEKFNIHTTMKNIIDELPEQIKQGA